MDDRSPESVERRIAELRDIAIHAIQLHEIEKQQIAHQLHDDFGSSLTALSMRLAAIARQTPAEPGLQEQWLKANAVLKNLIQSARRIQSDLYPGELQLSGLQSAIVELARNFENRTGISCMLEGIEGEPRMDAFRALAMYRMLQQLLSNVGQHAQARQTKIALDFGERTTEVTVSDDGVGFDVDSFDRRRTHGLRSISERMQLLDGSLYIESQVGRGTSVRIVAPNFTCSGHVQG